MPVRNTKGSMLAEATAAVSLLLPIIALTILVAIEASKAYVIARAMNEGAASAARAFAVTYKTDPNCNTDGTQNQIFSAIRIPNMITSNSQFTITSWNTGSTPKTVTVQVKYLPGQGSPALPPFPSPNPLHVNNLSIATQATYALQ